MLSKEMSFGAHCAIGSITNTTHSKTQRTMADNQEPESTGQIRPLAEVIGALKFLTRLPIPLARTVDHVPLHQSMRFFAVAGAVIGAAVGGVLWALLFVKVPPLLAAVLAYAMGIVITGALHEDGVADTFDGLAGDQDRERRLEIMRDSRNGTFGTLALVVTAAAKISCLFALTQLAGPVVVAICAAAAAFSRALIVDLLWATKPARSNGLSHMAGRPSRNTVLLAVISGAVLVFYAGYLTHLVAAVYALALALCVTAIIRRWAVAKIGGQTGDICGAAQVLSEIAILIAFASTLH
jgi:adenosylcobinamide-GDP ribazoletransferase